MTRFNHDEALRRFLNAAQATTSTTAKPKTVREVKEELIEAFASADIKAGEPVWTSMDFADAEARVWAHVIDCTQMGDKMYSPFSRQEDVHAKRTRAWAYGTAGGVSWWNEMDGRGRGIAYPNGRGVMTPLIDGATGDIVLFTKAEQHAAGYGHDNDAFRVMKAMERFDELKVIR